MIEKELKEENKILRNNIKDLEKQLHDAYIRIKELTKNEK
tara:strand:+ start:74 stop:193 length:120 start_codon:yes stop_codon:yes gene_type:complete